MLWRFGWDADGDLKTVTRPDSKVTAFVRNELKQVIRQDLPLPGASIGLQRDKQGNLTALTDPRGLVTTHAVNGLGDIKAVSSPDAGGKTIVRDANGNVTSYTDARNKTTSYTYDVANRLKSITYASGTPVTLEYDGGPTPVAPNIGQLTKITDESGTTSYSFDVEGRLLTKTQVTNGKTLATAYAYGTTGSSGQAGVLHLPGQVAGGVWLRRLRPAVAGVRESGGEQRNSPEYVGDLAGGDEHHLRGDRRDQRLDLGRWHALCDHHGRVRPADGLPAGQAEWHGKRRGRTANAGLRRLRARQGVARRIPAQRAATSFRIISPRMG
jgi:YD repeat-containing protein